MAGTCQEYSFIFASCEPLKRHYPLMNVTFIEIESRNTKGSGVMHNREELVCKGVDSVMTEE